MEARKDCALLTEQVEVGCCRREEVRSVGRLVNKGLRIQTKSYQHPSMSYGDAFQYLLQ